ncbi:hypothetical protein [Coraliomargarita sinensis]|uniref:hypothetical protein n=1 Tax=Coraliomargarita sinensis TaxID=2174842 RepID=UPI00130500EC|nr:hypothetical protein [Coraliomargarita sinensis]
MNKEVRAHLLKQITQHVVRDRFVLMAALLIWLCLEVAMIAIHFIKGASFYKMTGDVTAIFQAPPWIGFYSQAGLLLWSAAASFCLLAYKSLRSRSNHATSSRFLLGTGCFTLLLLIDDTYLLHETVLPHYGIPQILVQSAYLAGSFIYLCCFRKALLASNYVLLLAAGTGLGLSILSDTAHLWLLDRHLFEDSLKLFGIAFWAAYCFSISKSALTGPLSKD